jgi:hypothetical protein
MKKTTFLAIFLIICLGSMAQEEKTIQYRPAKKNFTVEVNFKPFNAETPITIDGFRGRLFLGNKIAIRAGFNFDYKKKYNETPVKENNTLYYNTADERYTVLGLTTGIEYHFLNSKRFSPYIGFIIGYENKTSKSEYNEVNYYGYPSDYRMDKTEIKNSWYETYIVYDGSGYYSLVTQLSERGYSRFSGNVVLGPDFYLFPHFYMGLELGAGYNALVYKAAEVDINGVFDKKYPKSTETSVGINLNNAIRVGFWF